MLIGARTAAWRGGAKWANPYVTDGLVAMWDGEWNSIGEDGIPFHDNNATSVSDLSGNGFDMTLIKDGTRFKWGDKSYNISLSGTGGSMCGMYIQDEDKSVLLTNSVAHLEVCVNDLERGQRVLSTQSVYRYLNCVNDFTTFGLGEAAVKINMFDKAVYANISPVSLGPVLASSTRAWFNGVEGNVYKGWATINDTATRFSLMGRYGYNYNLVYAKFLFARVYDRHLTDEEIVANYAVDKARFGLP